MKIILLTSNDHISANIAVRKFLENPWLKKNNIEVSGVIMRSAYTLNEKSWGEMKKFMKQSGWEFSIKNVVLATWKKIKIKFGRYFVSNKKRHYFDIEELSHKHHASFLEVNDINNESSKEFIKNINPDYLVSCSLLQIIDKEILNLPVKGSINAHPALTQEHRGTFTSFWAIMNRLKNSGATVHFMTDKVDKGHIILQRRFLVKKSDTLHCINEKSAKLSAKLLVKALIKLKKEESKGYKIKKIGKWFTVPTHNEVKQFYNRGKSLIKIKDLFKT